jgi:two-component system, NarL family, sensor histidine kinase DegS
MNSELDVNQINLIVKKTISGISSSMNQVLQIVDNVRIEQANLIDQLDQIRIEISDVIDEVDMLEKQDKIMRKKLAEVSSDFAKFNEANIKEVYEQASEVRIRYLTKKNEEKALRQRRDSLEITFKKTIQNIESGEKVVNQISIALNYLEGDIMSLIEGQDKNSEMFIGIKILEAQENERKRIARDIHDGPAQYMANAIMKADLCTRLMKKDINEGLKELADLKESMKTALKEVRGIIFDLRPMSLDDLGLNQTIRETVNSIIDESGIDIQIRLKPMKENAEVEAIIQVALYRIIQEIFNNIKKHSKAKHVELLLDYGTKYLALVITDDGIGFDVEETLLRVKTKGTSYGLLGIYDRVSQLQGDLKIKSEKGAGTVYNVKLPINREVIKDEKQGN